MPQPQQQPRRILEKSRTVRRRYQRSNKRFEFSASQIQRIEREEEREKKAKQLREREKKKLANKKKRAEKEAKEREERRRLGIPEPNACKIPASQPLLLNFFGAGRKKEGDVKEQIEEETEDSAMTQESASEEDSIEVEDERKQDILSPVQEEEESKVMPLQQPQHPSKTDDTTNCIPEDFSDPETELGDDFPVQEEEPDAMQPQQPQQLHQPQKADDSIRCVSEDFSDLETELGEDWIDDPELEKHMASIGNTQKSLSSSAATHKDDQPTEPAQSVTNKWAGMTESFEDDTSLMLQALDPAVLEEFETPQPKVVLHEVNKTAASCPSVSAYAASNIVNGNAQYDTHRVNNLTPMNFRNASPATNWRTPARQTPHEIVPQQQIAENQPLRNNATNGEMKTPTVHNTPPAFKKPVVAASMQPRRLHFSPKKSFNQSTKVYPTHKVYPQPYFDAEDEFGDLPLSTQDVRDLDSMVGLG